MELSAACAPPRQRPGPSGAWCSAPPRTAQVPSRPLLLPRVRPALAPGRPLLRAAPAPTLPRPCVRAPRASLGFTSNPRMSVERAALSLLRDAASLLCMPQSVKTPPGQALLRLLLLLSRGDDALRVLEAHGEFLRLLENETSHASWQDCLLESVLQIEDCPFATAAAAAPAKDSPLPPHTVAAAAADLGALQRLAVADSTLVSWVCSVAPEQPEEWRRAVETPRTQQGGGTGDDTAPGLNGGQASLAGAQGPASLRNAGVPGEAQWQGLHVRRWREDLGGQWAWGQATATLQAFYWEHGFGAPAVHRLLSWSESERKLVPLQSVFPLSRLLGPPPPGTTPDYSLPCQAQVLRRLVGHITAHAGADSAPLGPTLRLPALRPRHLLLHGAPGMGKTHLLVAAVRRCLGDVSLLGGVRGSGRDSTGGEERAAGLPFGATRLRCVELHKETLKWLPQLLQAAAAMPQLRFLLLADDLSFRAGEEAAARLHAFLGENLSCTWPQNVMLMATSVSRDLMRPKAALPGTVSPSPTADASSTGIASAPFPGLPDSPPHDSLGALFLEAEELPVLDHEQYCQCLEELGRAMAEDAGLDLVEGAGVPAVPGVLQRPQGGVVSQAIEGAVHWVFNVRRA